MKSRMGTGGGQPGEMSQGSLKRWKMESFALTGMCKRWPEIPLMAKVIDIEAPNVEGGTC